VYSCMDDVIIIIQKYVYRLIKISQNEVCTNREIKILNLLKYYSWIECSSFCSTIVFIFSSIEF